MNDLLMNIIVHQYLYVKRSKLTSILQISESKQKSSTKELAEKIVQKIVQRGSEYFLSFPECF